MSSVGKTAGHKGEGEEHKEGIKSEIDELITQERVVIFSKSTCPYCVDAKNVFEEIGQSYSVVELNDHPKGGDVQDVLKEMTGASTVPRVFVDGKCIGGGSDTVQLYKTGALEQILKSDSATEFGYASAAAATSRGENLFDGF